MRLYASAETVEDISYTVDWIGFDLPDGPYIIFDLQGEQDYCAGLNLRFKGDALPWTIQPEDEIDEIDLSNLDDNEIAELGVTTIAELLKMKPEITLGFSIDANDDDLDIFDRHELTKDDTFANRYLRLVLPEGEYEFSHFNIEIAGE